MKIIVSEPEFDQKQGKCIHEKFKIEPNDEDSKPETPQTNFDEGIIITYFKTNIMIIILISKETVLTFIF